MTRREQEDAIRREVEQWPGVSATFGEGRKHPRVTVEYQMRSVFVVYPATPSDSARGVHNLVGELRRALLKIGAERATPEPREEDDTPYRKPNDGKARRPDPVAREPVEQRDPLGPLREVARGPLITSPGFYPHVTPAQYFAEPCPAPALTNSGISILLRSCPARFAYEHPAIGQPPEETKESTARYIGKLVHRLALDKGDEYVVSPYDRYQSNEAKAWRDEIEASGRVPVKKDMLDEAMSMASAARSAIVEQTRGEPYETEVVIAWQRRGRWCRAMLDVWCPSLLMGLDLKTCLSADDGAIDRAFANGYGRQDAWYREAIERLTGRTGRSTFAFLFVEKDPPNLIRAAEASEAMRTGCMLECDRAFERFDACMTAGEWPGYGRHRSQPTPWQVRDWAEAELEDAA